MKKEDKKSFVKSLIETDENIHLFLILLSIVGLIGFYFWLSYNPKITYSRSVSNEELKNISAEEYINLMRHTSILIIPETVVGWPKPKDIPYLLKLVERTEEAGSTNNSDVRLVNLKGEYKSTVGINAVFLLKAIKEKAMHPYMANKYPADKDKIVSWAKEEIDSWEPIIPQNEGNIKKEELVKLSASEAIEMLKRVSLLTVCKDYESDYWGPYAKNWPRREDINYLLSAVNNTQKIGVFTWCGWSVIPIESEAVSTVGDTALLLLNAIKLEQFLFSDMPKPENPEEIIAWARAEAAMMEQEKAQKQNTPLP